MLNFIYLNFENKVPALLALLSRVVHILLLLLLFLILFLSLRPIPLSSRLFLLILFLLLLLFLFLLFLSFLFLCPSPLPRLCISSSFNSFTCLWNRRLADDTSVSSSLPPPFRLLCLNFKVDSFCRMSLCVSVLLCMSVSKLS